MSIIQPEYEDRVRYRLSYQGLTPIDIPEPKGWRSDAMEFNRNETHHGIFPQFTNNLKYRGEGADFITFIRDLYGPNAKIRQTRDEKHPDTNQYINQYFGDLEIPTYGKKKGEVSIKFDKGGIDKDRQARGSDKLEIERTVAINGNVLSDLVTNQLALDGRKIFLQSTLDNGGTTSGNFTNTQAFRSPELEIVSEDDDHIQSVFEDFIPYTIDGSFQWTDLNPTEANCFYVLNDRQKTLRLRGDFRLRNIPTSSSANNSIDFALVRVDENFDVIDGEYLYQSGLNTDDWREVSFDHEIVLQENEGLMLVIVSQAFFNNTSNTNHSIQYDRSNMIVEEDSFFDASQTKMILVHELCARIIEIITGRKDAFYSEALGRTDIGYSEDGFASLHGFSHGHWIRGFDKEPGGNENKYKAFATSFIDILEHLDTRFGLALGIERIGFYERFRIEKREFFYNQNVLVHLGYQDDNGNWIYPRVSDFERKEAPKYYQKSVKLGYAKGWENEEAMGLDEPNAQSNWSTILNDGKDYVRISKYIAGTYPKEFIRRKPKVSYPTEDHRNDTEIFCHDVKRGETEIWEERKWQDDYASAPSGIYDPDSAGNLGASPAQLFRNHGWWINAGLEKYQTDLIRFGSSQGNSGLTQQQIDALEYSERDDILPTNLRRAAFKAESMSFKYPVDFKIIEQLNGHTIIDGKKVPNIYGLVKFRNDEGVLEKGFILNSKLESNKFKLLTSSR